MQANVKQTKTVIKITDERFISVYPKKLQTEGFNKLESNYNSGVEKDFRFVSDFIKEYDLNELIDGYAKIMLRINNPIYHDVFGYDLDFVRDFVIENSTFPFDSTLIDDFYEILFGNQRVMDAIKVHVDNTPTRDVKQYFDENGLREIYRISVQMKIIRPLILHFCSKWNVSYKSAMRSSNGIFFKKIIELDMYEKNDTIENMLFDFVKVATQNQNPETSDSELRSIYNNLIQDTIIKLEYYPQGVKTKSWENFLRYSANTYLRYLMLSNERIGDVNDTN